MPTINGTASIYKRNRNPNITAIIPIMISIIPTVGLAGLMLEPKNIVEIPKNSRLNPTIIEMNPVENIGSNMNIKPIIIVIIPEVFSKAIHVTSVCLSYILYILKSIIYNISKRVELNEI